MRQTGQLKTWIVDKGYGFVSVAGCPDTFVHQSDVEDGIAPAVGDTLSFEAVETAKGLRAVQARIENGAA